MTYPHPARLAGRAGFSPFTMKGDTMTTTKATHTPGPWRADGAVRVQGDGYDICRLCTIPIHKDEASALANARLIAAAPDLLEACWRAADYFHNFTEHDDEEVEIAKMLREARMKAVGQ